MAAAPEDAMLINTNKQQLRNDIDALKKYMRDEKEKNGKEAEDAFRAALTALTALEAAIPEELLPPEKIADFEKALLNFDKAYDDFQEEVYEPENMLPYSHTFENHPIVEYFRLISLSGRALYTSLSQSQSKVRENYRIVEDDVYLGDNTTEHKAYAVGKADPFSDKDSADEAVPINALIGYKDEVSDIPVNVKPTKIIDHSNDDEPLCADVFFEAFRNLPKQIQKHPIITAGVVVLGLVALGCIYVGVTGLTHGATAIPGAMAMAKAFSAAVPILKDCAMALSLGAAGAIGIGVSAALLSFFPKVTTEDRETILETLAHKKPT